MSNPLEYFRANYHYCPTCGSLIFSYPYTANDGSLVADCTDSPGCAKAVPLTHVGWFYWWCFPGCLPDSEPIGPFETQELAKVDAECMDFGD